MLGMAPDYDHLTVIQKVEVFRHALDSTSGETLPHPTLHSARTPGAVVGCGLGFTAQRPYLSRLAATKAGWRAQIAAHCSALPSPHQTACMWPPPNPTYPDPPPSPLCQARTCTRSCG